ncbi:HAD family hydrolase [Rhodophyticola porphyridii]|uniref:HAD-IB family hydrolase n=1 Tax=Rhodophyticola porphyridii TaxID=1852017 RepID=A0A3L9Y2J5_9RHOB|nr:HAD-IB family hydrolase [Rhodophyticola porphyridii]RMA42672.1 HAD-IB family hydrolase [Rhodophyticola porphyridii]
MPDIRPAPSLAVFDVDETLIECKSMFSFLEFAFREVAGDTGGAQAYRAALYELQTARETEPREVVNRLFYRNFSRWSLDQLAELSQEWFARSKARSFYVPEVLNRFRQHQAQGHETVLLSGSANFIVAPIADDLGATGILAIALKRLPDGTTDGQIEGIQTIGEGKAAALRNLIQARGPYVRTFGYGDHQSDLPFLAICDEAYCAHPADRPAPEWAEAIQSFPIHGQASTAGSITA